MNITDISFAIDMLSHPQSGDESDINMALDIAIESLKAWREALEQEPKCTPVSERLPDRHMKLYHVTTQKKAKKYKETGCILKPVRGFNTLEGAMAWAIKTGRNVIYEIEGEPAYKLPDHHNKYGSAYWIDDDIDYKDIHCVRFE